MQFWRDFDKVHYLQIGTILIMKVLQKMVQVKRLPIKKRKIRPSVFKESIAPSCCSSLGEIPNVLLNQAFLNSGSGKTLSDKPDVVPSNLKECEKREDFLFSADPQDYASTFRGKTGDYEPSRKLEHKMCPKWLRRFEELKVFKKKHGHCHVPQRYVPNKSLGKWVHKQRQIAKNSTKNLNLKRLRALQSIGFWLEPPDKIEIVWNQRYAELVEYRNNVGDCSVPQRFQANIPLGMWVHRQRGEMKRLFQGKKTKMSLKRLQALIEIGFNLPHISGQA